MTPMNSACPGGKMSGTKFNQTLVNRTPVYDNRRKHNKPAPKHRGNVRREPMWVK